MNIYLPLIALMTLIRNELDLNQYHQWVGFLNRA